LHALLNPIRLLASSPSVSLSCYASQFSLRRRSAQISSCVAPPMAPHHGSLADDWGDFRFTYEEPPASSSHRSQLADAPLEAQQILADYSFLVYPRPSPANIDVIAYNTWHSLSEHSDPASATAPLHPLEPISVQSDTQFNSSWVGSRAESVADSGFFSNTSTGFSTRQRLDSSSYSAPSFPHGIGTASSLDVFTQQTQPDALLNISESDPWYPGSRVRIFKC
jgi:hypothetical protein